MRRLPLAEFGRLDRNAEEMGIPLVRLMGRAGKALAQEALRMADREGPDVPIWFLCGHGNNGGDGFAAAGLLHVLATGERAAADGSLRPEEPSELLQEPPQAEHAATPGASRVHPLRVLLMVPKEKVTGAARAYLDALPQEMVEVWRRAPGPAPLGAVLVDCLLGSGARGAPRPPYDAALRWLKKQKEAGHRVLACDLPSTWGRQSAVVPEATVTFHAAKEGMTKADSGRIVVADIGIPDDAADRIGIGDLEAAYGRQDADAHKGDNGRVLVVGGGPFAGAPWYSALGAARSGADLVHVATPGAAARTIAAWGPTPLVHDIQEGVRLTGAGVAGVERLLEHVDGVVLGPGLGQDPDTLAATKKILEAIAQRGLPVVIDADGLDAVTPKWLRKHAEHTVLTPHAGEFHDLAGKQASDENVIAYAKRHGVTVARKGRIDLVTDGTTTRRCYCGHPTMTVGGTGDVLAGAIGALLARGAQPFAAASAGTYLVGSAGEIAGSVLGPGAQATDVHEAIPSVLMRLQ